MLSTISFIRQKRQMTLGSVIPEIGFCEKKARLMYEFLQAVQELTGFETQQTQAVIDGDSDFARFDILIHGSTERKDSAKYSLLAHIEAHGCGEV
jgi:hypothetical protein